LSSIGQNINELKSQDQNESILKMIKHQREGGTRPYSFAANSNANPMHNQASTIHATMYQTEIIEQPHLLHQFDDGEQQQPRPSPKYASATE